jgi:CheY-like chemotaxis protein
MPLDNHRVAGEDFFPNIIPQDRLRLPDALTIKHGPARLLSRMVLSGDMAARKLGLRLFLRHDFAELRDLNERQVAAGNWLTIPGAFNPDCVELTPENAFWLEGQNEAGETVVTWAARIHNWIGTNLAEQVRASWYGRDLGQPCVVTADAAQLISGVVVCGGASWVHPDFRGKHLSHLIPRIGKAYACARWPIDWSFCYISRRNVDKGLADSYGQKNLSYSVEYPGSPWGEVVIAYTAIDDVYDDFAKFVASDLPGELDREAAGDKLPSDANSVPRAIEHTVTRTSSDRVYQAGRSRCGRILLTEDDEDVRALVQEALLEEGYQVDATDTVAGALSLLDNQQPYDLLFTDGMLPDGTGLTIAGKARARKIKVMLFTGYANAFPSEELAQYPVLMKPAEMDDVVRAVGRVLHA